MKSEKMKWYILVAVALLVGAIIGYFATANLATEGNAKGIVKSTSLVVITEEGKKLVDATMADCVCEGSPITCIGRPANCSTCCDQFLHPEVIK